MDRGCWMDRVNPLEEKMVERISARQFHAAEGVDEWRALFGGVKAQYATGSFSAGIRLVDAIGRLADAANHHPDIDLRYSGVTVRLFTHEIGDISERDLALARQISEAALELGFDADPSAVQTTQIT
ncbi:MAG: pterin-4-alpha-carbinolamine dehydratase, partial [Subtercola sp.]|nr:pterin-4-alpha-carbinolamine dehydratase [Subtercola sp.]